MTDFLNSITKENYAEKVVYLRKIIIVGGIPRPLQATSRGDIWKLLLGVDSCDAERYIALVERGESKFNVDIRKDASRTFRVS
jgi:hypothetical protein